LKTPICSFDAKAGILCPKCDARLRSGHLTKADVDLSVKLTKLAERFGELNRLTLVRALQVDGDYVLAVGKGDGTFLRNNAKVVEEIEKEVRGGVWIVEAETSDRRMIEEIFYPVRILTVNVVWLPDGSKLTKVIIPSRRGEKLPLDVEKIKNVAKAVRGIDLLVEVER